MSVSSRIACFCRTPRSQAIALRVRRSSTYSSAAAGGSVMVGLTASAFVSLGVRVQCRPNGPRPDPITRCCHV